MSSNVISFRTSAWTTESFYRAEELFRRLISADSLESQLSDEPSIGKQIDNAIQSAIELAFYSRDCNEEAMRFLQRILYRINRLNFFWFDDLSNYNNERSPYISILRKQLEDEWLKWELKQIDIQSIQNQDPEKLLLASVAEDLNPRLSNAAHYLRNRMNINGYRRLLEIAALDGMVEASQLSRTLGGSSNNIQSTLTRVFLEEYGNGKLSRKHSSYFESMLNELGLNAKPEAYLDSTPWEVLASINLSFLHAERKRFYLRYVGGLTYFEVSVPASFRNYTTAAERLGLPKAAYDYWSIHIKEDERHGVWMIEHAAIPLMRMYGSSAWEVMLGYKLQKALSERAGNAVVAQIKKADFDGESCTDAATLKSLKLDLRTVPDYKR